MYIYIYIYVYKYAYFLTNPPDYSKPTNCTVFCTSHSTARKCYHLSQGPIQNT